VDSDDNSGSNSSSSDEALDETTMAEVIPFKSLRGCARYKKPKRISENSPSKKETLESSPVIKKRKRKMESDDHRSEINPITRIRYQNRNLIKSSLEKNEPKKGSFALSLPKVIMVDAATQTDIVLVTQVT